MYCSPALSNNRYLNPILVFVLSGRLRQVLLNMVVVAVRFKVVILLLIVRCLLMLPLCVGNSCLILVSLCILSPF